MDKIGKRIHFFDSLIILLNLSNSYSIVPYLLFHQHHRAVNTGLIFVINLVYLLYRFKFVIEVPKAPLFRIYVLICAVNVVSSALSATGFFLPWLYLLANSSFFVLLYNCYNEYQNDYDRKTSLWLTIRGYIWLVAICITGALLLFLLMKLGLNPYQNEISSSMDLFDANVEQFNTEHFFPYYLSILLKDVVEVGKMPFFNDMGIVCGIYHEPHIITFMVFPALFFLFAFVESNKTKVCLFLIWLFVMLMTTSTMNIIAFTVCICIFLAFNKWGKIMLIPLFGVFVMLVVYIGLENTELFFIIDKLEGGSMDYSLQMIKFAFTPHTIIGSNFMSTDYLQQSVMSRRDVGYISFGLNLLFLLFFYIKNLRVILSDKLNRMIGLGVLYFMLHSLKVSMVAYTLSMLAFMMFIVSYPTEEQEELIKNDEGNSTD